MMMETNTNTHVALNRQVANLTVLYTKLHNLHWYVKGPHFLTLHAKFEALYDYVAETLDEVAERLIAVGGQPVATLKQSLEVASVAEVSESLSPEQMVETVVNDFKLLVLELTELMDIAQKTGDEGTSDLALGIKTTLEKEIWILSSIIEK